MDDTLSAWIFEQLQRQPLLGVLMILIGADILSGRIVAAARRQLNSTVSLLGMSRKALVLILVGVARVIEPHAGDLPLTKLVAGCFCATELLSILENAIALGVPVPRAFRDVLKKFSDESEIDVPAQTLVVRPHKRPSDVVLLDKPPPTSGPS